jgi:outer membrane protein assembly factor BamB
MDSRLWHPLKGIPIALIAVALLVPTERGRAGDWTQYRGPNHDGVSTDRIATNWLSGGPPRLWAVPLKGGYSSFTVSQGRAFTQVVGSTVSPGEEVCIALDAEDGAELWATRVRDSGMNGSWQPPYSTPTVDGNRVYVLSTDLALFCLDAVTGQVIWQTDLIAQYGGVKPGYGNAASPAVDGDFVFVNCNAQAGDRLLAFRKADGSLAWKVAAGPPDYATPIAAAILGVRQIIFNTKSELVSIAPESGEVLWSYGMGRVECFATPVAAGDIVFAAFRMGGASALRITHSDDGFRATQIWGDASRINPWSIEWSTPVCHDGYLYGLFDSGYLLKCVELTTGDVKWSRTGFDGCRGGILVVDGHLLILTDRGRLVLVEPNPAAYTELARFQALTGDCYNHPAIYNGRIYAQHQGSGVLRCGGETAEVAATQPPDRRQLPAPGHRCRRERPPA